MIALVADLISVNRKLLEKVDLRLADLEEQVRSSGLAPEEDARGWAGGPPLQKSSRYG